mmetsp:Transcript_2630/g.6163  ORF Transcript_2630/g.6163 Transcript_2630/m.6163 type:complete len:228 (+) Transcript_2630:1419-2102(+)
MQLLRPYGQFPSARLVLLRPRYRALWAASTSPQRCSPAPPSAGGRRRHLPSTPTKNLWRPHHRRVAQGSGPGATRWLPWPPSSHRARPSTTCAYSGLWGRAPSARFSTASGWARPWLLRSSRRGSPSSASLNLRSRLCSPPAWPTRTSCRPSCPARATSLCPLACPRRPRPQWRRGWCRSGVTALRWAHTARGPDSTAIPCRRSWTSASTSPARVPTFMHGASSTGT